MGNFVGSSDNSIHTNIVERTCRDFKDNIPANIAPENYQTYVL